MAEALVSSEAVTIQKSTFQAHVAHVTEFGQVKASMAALLRNNKIRNATHNIMAYRIFVPEKGTFLQVRPSPIQRASKRVP